MRLLFNNLEMTEGLNITVRRGDKWFGFRGTVEVAESDLLSSVFDVEVVHTVAVDHFIDLAGEGLLLGLGHDPSCREFSGLLAAMRGAYSGFDPRDPATVVFFVAPSLKG